MSIDVQFWGVRDQIPTPGATTVRYGGNTSCVEVRIGSQRLVFDGGTGLRSLGNNLLSQMPVTAHLFFTHCHWDRIQGFPFFVPAFIPINHFHIYGANASNGATFQQRLSKQMLGPNFPVPIQVMQSKLEFHILNGSGDQTVVEDVVVETCYLNPEHNSVGYRVNAADKTVVYAMSPNCAEEEDQSLLCLAKDADLLILAAPQHPPVHPSLKPEKPQPIALERWLAGIDLAKEANVDQVVMSLHHPDHEDDYLDEVESQLQAIFPKASLAKEGMTVAIV